MIGPTPRVTTSNALNNQRPTKAGAEPKMLDLHASLQESAEELAMARSKFQQKDKATISQERSRFLENKPELMVVVSEALGDEAPTQERIMNMLAKIKDDVSRYQLLRFLLESGQLDAVLYQFINSELEKLRKKRTKISSLDQINGDTTEFESIESLDGIMLQNLYVDLLEYDGHITGYFETLFKSSRKYKKIASFLSKMINYDIYGYSPNENIDSYIYLNEKRRYLNMIANVYNHFDTEKYRYKWFVISSEDGNESEKDEKKDHRNQDEKNKKDEELNYDPDLLFISSIFMNIDVDSFCSKMDPNTVSMLINYFNKTHVDLFYSVEDKTEVLDTMKSNISHRFVRNGIR